VTRRRHASGSIGEQHKLRVSLTRLAAEYLLSRYQIPLVEVDVCVERIAKSSVLPMLPCNVGAA
jgi:hypothetical protein